MVVIDILRRSDPTSILPRPILLHLDGRIHHFLGRLLLNLDGRTQHPLGLLLLNLDGRILLQPNARKKGQFYIMLRYIKVALLLLIQL